MFSRPTIRLILPVVIMASIVRPVLAQSGPGEREGAPVRRTHTIIHTDDPIRVDAIADEPIWLEAVPIEISFEWQPGDNTPAPVQTSVRLVYSDDCLYALFQAGDPDPAKIRAFLRDRDQGTEDDQVGLMIDTFNNTRQAFQFRVNAAGVQMDAVFSDLYGFEDWSWDAIWESAARITSEGYTVEVGIPFDALRFPDTGDVQTWGILVFRDWPREVRHRLRSCRTDRSNATLLNQVDLLTGLIDIRPGRSIELDPTFTTIRSDQIPEGGLFSDPRRTDLIKGGTESEPGLSVTWGITSNLTLNGAVNPDFSQVEADVAQLEVNRRFAISYPERRPFFLEGADYFTSYAPLVVTRTVVDPSFGLKLTGKEGRHGLGAFVTRDRVTSLLFPSNQRSRSTLIETPLTTAVFRHRYDLGHNSTLGLFLTDREGGEYVNRMAVVDGNLRLNRSTSLVFLLGGTRTAYPDSLSARFAQPSGPFSGNLWYGMLMHNSREWMYSLAARGLSDGFRLDTGFAPFCNQQDYFAHIRRRFWGEAGTWFTRLETGPGIVYAADFSGNLLSFNISYGVWYYGPLQSSLNVQVSSQSEAYAGREFTVPGVQLQGSMQPSGHLTLALNAQAGGAIDYTNVREADQLLLTPEVEIRLGRRFAATVRHSYQRLSNGSQEIFTVGLSELRLLYHLSVRMFARAIIQYQSIESNPGMYSIPVNPRNNNLFTQFLYSYKLNPRTVFFLGYSDTCLGGDFAAGIGRLSLTRTARTFFMKIGYALTM